MTESADRVKEVYQLLHQIPEVGFEEIKTSAFLAEQLRLAGFEVQTGVGGTGVIGIINGSEPGPVVGLRADMDALAHLVDGKECAIHSCGHDSHSAMVLTVAERFAKHGIKKGTLKIIFQPAEEKLFGARRMIEDGAIDDVDCLLGIHLRPIQEAKFGQATPALYHGASYIVEAELTGQEAHGARPHLGVNAIDAAAAVVNAVNAIHMNPAVPATTKTTRLIAGGPAPNAIPAKAQMVFDLRAQENGLMDDLIQKTCKAIEAGAATVGAQAAVTVKGGVPAAEYNQELVELAREAVVAVLGNDGLIPPIISPGGEDFHFFAKHKPALKAAYIGLGCDLTPGLHHPKMSFNQEALIYGVEILSFMVERLTK